MYAGSQVAQALNESRDEVTKQCTIESQLNARDWAADRGPKLELRELYCSDP